MDPKLTLRWQAVVYVLGAGLAFVWLEAMGLDAPVAGKGLLGIVLAGLVAVAH